jgi:phosphate:Na+ symporter
MLLGGLALFLHGMQMMSSGLEAAAGNQMKVILERLTANRFLGVLVGALITAVVQSSSATTVMVVGFVSADMMTLNQAVWIIMGANIGTTFTSVLIAMDVGAMAPVLAFLGVVLMVFVKRPRAQHVGQILAGLGILFLAMEMMSAAMYPLRDSPAFARVLSTFSNPLIGIAAGALFTALIQSSSASVGVLQTLAGNGVIGLGSAVYVLFGQNIGTCITALMASAGANRNAKRVALVQLLFNVTGTILFTVFCMFFPLTTWIEGLLPGMPQAQIAAMHILFNVTTTLLLLPLGNQLARLAVRLLPDRAEQQEPAAMSLVYLTPVQAGGVEGGLGVSAIVMDQLRKELHRMLAMSQENVDAGFQAVLDRDVTQLEQVEQREEYIDYLNREISGYISKLIAVETNERSSTVVSGFFTIAGNIERIGDHADNLAGYTRLLVERDICFSDAARKEIGEMRTVSMAAISALLSRQAGSQTWLRDVAQMEQDIDDMTERFRQDQLTRMKAGACSEEECILYSEMLTDFERIGDHVLNIAQELTRAQTTL